MITSNNSPTRDSHKAVDGWVRSAILEAGHRFAGKDCIASWNPSNPWRDTELWQPASTPLLAGCPKKGQV
jgi:hypothetical protein